MRERILFDILIGLLAGVVAGLTQWLLWPLLEPLSFTLVYPAIIFVTILLVASRRKSSTRNNENKERLELAVKVTKLGIWDLDLKTHSLHWDQQMLSIHGLSKESFGSTLDDWKSVVHPEDREELFAALNSDEDGTKDISLNFRIVRPDGDVRDIRVSAKILFDATGNAIRIVGSGRDITETNNLLEALTKDAERCALALEGANLGAWDWDMVSNEIALDDRWCGMLGYKIDEIPPILDSWKELMHPEDSPRVLEGLESYIKGDVPNFSHELRMKHKDGHWVWVSDRGKIFERDSTGKATRMTGTHLDISERKEAEEKLNAQTKALQKNEDLLQRIGDLAQVGGWELDLATSTPFWTTETYKIHEVDPEKIPSLEDGLSHYPPPGRKTLVEAIALTKDHQIPYDLELPFVTAKGRPRWVRTQGYSVVENGETVKLVGAFQDITERKNNELSLNLSREAAEKANEMKAHFLDIAAHELRTPVASLSLLLEMAQLNLSKGSPVNAETLNRLGIQSDRLRRIVVDLLDVSQLERGRMAMQLEQVEFASIVREAVENFQLSSPDRIIRVKGLDKPLEIHIDGSRILQVLTNLIGNANSYTPMDKPIEILVTSTSHELQISIVDRGPGIEDSLLDRLFERFSRGVSDREASTAGLGLGLFISKSIVEMHGGTIGVNSEAGVGSTFYFNLPLKRVNA